MTIKELDSRFTAAALESAAAADALGLDSRGLRALCEGHGAAAGLKRSLQRGQPTPSLTSLPQPAGPPSPSRRWRCRAALPSSSPTPRRTSASPG